MRYQWMDALLLALPGVERDYKVEWDMVRFMVGGRMFAAQGGNKEKRPILTIKVEPEWGEALRKEYADIVPGYYSNKQHWCSVYREGSVPDDTVRDMLLSAYELVKNALPKKVQQELQQQGT